MPFERFDIAGEKIRLRPVRVSDAENVYDLLKNDAVFSQLKGDGPKDMAEERDILQRREADWKTSSNLYLAIESTSSLEFVGNISARFRIHPQQADIGYWIGEPYWNRGYMTEAIRLVCHICFKHLNSNKIYATVFVGNVASCRVLEKNGFSLDGTLRRHVYKWGTWKDAWFLSLLAEEWEARKDYYLPRFEDVVVLK
jgi:RimJ/RimL family protein N-acetyltransferase